MASVIETGGFGFERFGAVASYTTTTLSAVNAAHTPVVIVAMRSGTAGITVAATMGGVSLGTPQYAYDSNGSNYLAFFLGAKGQTGQVVVTFTGGSSARGAVLLQPISGANSWTLLDTSFSTSSTTTNVNFPIDAADDGIIIAASFNSGNGTATPAWVGVDLVQTIPLPVSSPSNIVSIGAKVITPAELNRTITSGWSSGSTRTNAAIALSPVSAGGVPKQSNHYQRLRRAA